MEALGRRLVACKHFRWVPGMLVYGRSVQPSGWLGRVRLTESHEHPTQLRDPWPDLADGATRGAVLALVREAYADPSFAVRCVAGLWYEESSTRALVARGSDTEADAIVAALEVAP